MLGNDMVRLAFYETSFGSQMVKEGTREQTKVEAERQVVQAKSHTEPKQRREMRTYICKII